jgi:diguanylate cyclase (GGDEF)-like protein
VGLAAHNQWVAEDGTWGRGGGPGRGVCAASSHGGRGEPATGGRDEAAIRARKRQLTTGDEGEHRDEHDGNDLRQEVRELRDRLTSVEGHFRGAVDNSTDGVVVVNRDGIVVFANAAAAVMLGTTRSQLVGKPANFPVVNTTSRRPDHEVLLADMRLLSTDWDDEPAVLALLRDVTERSVADAEMAYRATHDPVTALPNRYLLDDRLRQALARDRRAPTTLAVLFCDVDGLKGINDRLGHGVGDQVLVETARRIESVIRPADTAAHLGGDEFVVLCESIDEDGATAVVDRVAMAFDTPMNVEGNELSVGVSVGLAMTSDPDVLPADLLAEADHAMYRAKQARRRQAAR